MAARGRKATGSAVRKITPLIPLAIPLAVAMLHGGSAGKQSGVPPASAPTIQSASRGGHGTAKCAEGTACVAPSPMLTKGHPVDWWFVFKLNASKFPLCGSGAGTDARRCLFGGDVQTDYRDFSQRFVFASSEAATLRDGGQECLGTSVGDPVGATFDEVYNGGFHYLLWNDQFGDEDPSVQGCSKGKCGPAWGHSKGMLAWNDRGEGLVMQVSTPAWPGVGNPKFHRKIGNTLGCIVDDNNVEKSQHFFALRLTKSDLMSVLQGLQEASVVTDPADAEIAQIGGPKEVVDLAKTLGTRSKLDTLDKAMPVLLSTGVRMIAKPSGLHVPPWQMVSAVLGGVSLRTATWWMTPKIHSTSTATNITCWDDSIPGKAGAVEIATTGTWENVKFGLTGGLGGDRNHAKIGVSTSGSEALAIFGDENQQGAIDGDCESSQNLRGGLFFVVKNTALAKSVGGLIAGESDPVVAGED